MFGNLITSSLTRSHESSVVKNHRQCKQAVREAATTCHRPLQFDLWSFDLESSVRVTCDVGYLCANFSLPRPLCSRLRPDVRDRRTSDVIRRQTSDVHRRLMPPPYRDGGIIMIGKSIRLIYMTPTVTYCRNVNQYMSVSFHITHDQQ